MIHLFLAASLASTLALGAGAPGDPDAKPAFERLKALVGDWEGSVKSKDGPQVRVSFRLTGGGSALVETQFPGTDHEMMSVYHMSDGRLVLTHYCAMGNQPRMRLSSASPTELAFAFDGGTNLDPTRDVHVHEGTVRFVSSDRIESEWAVFEAGKPAGTNRFFLSRKTDPR